MSQTSRASTPRRGSPSGLTLITAVMLAGALLCGCGGGDQGLGEDHAVRLTHGKGLKEFPCFSPDGREIAFSVSTAEREYDYSVRIVSAEGGEPRDLTSNDIPQVCLSWSADGSGLYTLNIWDTSLRLVGMDGTVLARYPFDGMAEPVAVSPTGDRFLYRRRVDDGVDMGIRLRGKSGLQILARTPEWEVDGCFGPGDGVTVVRQATAWAEDSEIAVWSPETHEYTPLVLPGDRTIDPSWSADGRFLAYASDESGDFDIWVHDRESMRALRVTSGPADDRYPSWSPDGHRLAYCRWAVVSHVFVADMGSETVQQLTSGRSRDRYPVVSPDGQWVVFARTETPVDLPRAPALCVASTSGGPIRQLDTEALRVHIERDGVSWAPNSAEIAFPADDGTGNVDIYRVAREGGIPARVTIRRGPDYDPAWSPDGTCIAYTRGKEGEAETDIWVIPATGGVPERVSSSPGVNREAVWAPDSDRIVHYSFAGTVSGGADLWLSYRSRPGRSKLLLRDGGVNIPLAWSQDGSTVLYRREGVDDTSVWAIPADGGSPVRIGERAKEPGAGSDLIRLDAAGREYLGRLFPGRMQAYAEGEDLGDIFLIEISALLRSEF